MVYLKHYRTLPLLFHSIGLSDSQHERKKRTGWSTANNWTALHWWATNWILAEKKRNTSALRLPKNFLSWTGAMFYESDFFGLKKRHYTSLSGQQVFYTSKPLTHWSHFYMPVMFFASESCVLALDRVTKGGFVAGRASDSPAGLTRHSQGAALVDWHREIHGLGNSASWEILHLFSRKLWVMSRNKGAAHMSLAVTQSHCTLNKTWKLKPQKDGTGVPHILHSFQKASHKVFCCTWNCCLSLACCTLACLMLTEFKSKNDDKCEWV